MGAVWIRIDFSSMYSVLCVHPSRMAYFFLSLSAGVSTGIGEHVEDLEDKGDEQFEISDGRSVAEVYGDLERLHLQPVMADYVYV